MDIARRVNARESVNQRNPARQLHCLFSLASATIAQRFSARFMDPIPALPAHASFLRSKRQPAGGPETDAGVSNDTTVSVVQLGPLTPGVSYSVWVVDVNSRGEGPESNKITFTA
jgi:hypothetical protein